MNLWGYDDGFRQQKRPTLGKLEEVTIMPDDPDELRRIASFLIDAADLLQENRDAFDHKHYRDWAPDWSTEDCDLIVSPRKGP